MSTCGRIVSIHDILGNWNLKSDCQRWHFDCCPVSVTSKLNKLNADVCTHGPRLHTLKWMWVWGVASFINHKTAEGHFVYWLDLNWRRTKLCLPIRLDTWCITVCVAQHRGSGQVTLLQLYQAESFSFVIDGASHIPLTLWPIIRSLSTAAEIHRWTVWSLSNLFHTLTTRALMWPDGDHWYKIISCNLS